MYILTSKYFPTDSWPDDYFPALPEGVVDIQYKEVVEFSLAIASTAEFEVVLPNDESVTVSDTSTIIVAGAGTTAVNGTYVYTAMVDSKPSFGTGGNIIRWFSDNGVWLILVEPFNYYYRSFDDVATPDLVTTWIAVDGEDPVPTVTEAQVPTLTEVATFTLEMPMVIDAEIKNVTVSIGAEQTGAEYGTAIYGVDYYGSSLIIPIGVILNVVLTLSLRILEDKAVYYSELSKEVVE